MFVSVTSEWSESVKENPGRKQSLHNHRIAMHYGKPLGNLLLSFIWYENNTFFAFTLVYLKLSFNKM